MISRDRIVELCGHADSMTRTSHAPLKNRRDIQLVGYGAYIRVLSLERERRRACSNLQLVDAREVVKYLLCESVGEVLLAWISAHVYKRQHRNGMWRWCKRNR